MKVEISSELGATSKGFVPFWMRSNKNGSIPLSGISGSLLLKLYKDYETLNQNNSVIRKEPFDYGFGINLRGNLGNNSDAQLIEAYAKIKASIFQLKAGRSRDFTGFVGDSALTSGSFAVSGNALGVPKIEISIPEYFTIPIFGGIFSFKGTFSLGYLSQIGISDSLGRVRSDVPFYIISNVNHVGTLLHEKTFYGRLGKPDWRLQLYGGFSHQVFFGGEKQIYRNSGVNFNLSNLESFYHAATGKVVKVLESKIGNQLGNIDLGFSYDFEAFEIRGYRNFFYDIGALAHLANLRDGLTGITFVNKYTDNRIFNWNKILVEFLYTKNQAGMPWSPVTPSGDEDYYNNYVYRQGWTYKGLNLGTPFITQKSDAIQGQISDPKDFFINNRVMAFHIGFTGSIQYWKYLVKASYSKNYGTFATSIEGRSLHGVRAIPLYGIFREVDQFSSYVEIQKSFKNDIILSLGIALDYGRLLDNSSGSVFKISKTF